MNLGRRRIAWVVLLVLASSLAAGAESDLAHHVDPFIGTGGHGHTFPGATLPFGMVQLSPDTRLEGWDGCSGYHYSDSVVYGFSHTHLSGTGVSDYGDVLLMPMTGVPLLANGHGQGPEEGYASRFSKETERAGPGWYAVHLDDYDVDVELTATPRVGMHRYRFPRGRPAHVVVDLAHRDRVLSSSLRIVSDQEVEGMRRSEGWARDQVVHFVARFSRPFVEATLALGDEPREGETELRGTAVKGLLSFGDTGGELLIKVGISAVDSAGARRNLSAELPGWDFDETRQKAHGVWNDALSAVVVEGGTNEQRTVFYTALYHSLLAPNVFSDVDGRYRGMDREVHHATGRHQYTVFSLWDTFRATHPLLTLLEPERTNHFVSTFLAQYEQGGRLPVWELAGNETDCMIGYHSVSVIADAYAKGLRGFDAERALEAMVHSATGDHHGLEAYTRQGFIGAEDEPESVSKTLEYAYDDWCIAEVARALGRDRVAAVFERRSHAWRHLLDPDTGFMRARRNQRWLEPFDPYRVDNNYTEANAWQYSFFVPHHVEDLIRVLGGDAAFVARLDELFTAESVTTGRDQADITGLIGQYAHGNEPSHHVAWLYHFAGRPDRTQERVDQILNTLYSASPDGLSGNEDCGQMSSWYVLSAIGLYQVCPGRPEYVLGAPVFPQVTLRVGGGRELVIAARGSTGARYVHRVELDGQPRRVSSISHADLVAGGRLEIRLGPEPSPTWGRDPRRRPRSARNGPAMVPAPFVVADADTFRDRLGVDLRSAEAGARIRYITDATLSEAEGAVWSGPVELAESTMLSFRSETDHGVSPTVEATFHKIAVPWTVRLERPPDPQYALGGADVLIDGRRGPDSWRLGGWLGFQGADLEAVVDLGAPQPLSRVGASFLQDIRPWIWFPTEVLVSVSADGEEYLEVGRVGHEVPEDRRGLIKADLVVDVGGARARYVRLVARAYGTVPDWHTGHGGEAWIFVDEILIER